MGENLDNSQWWAGTLIPGPTCRVGQAWMRRPTIASGGPAHPCLAHPTRGPKENFMPFLAPVPDSHGRFGPYGGQYVPETLMFALEQLEEAYAEAREDR